MINSTNPLVAEYADRCCRHVSVARNAFHLLVTALHEAGHWAASAHFEVPVQVVEVDRRPGHAYRGYFRANDYLGFVEPGTETGVDYVCTMAGPLSQYLFDRVRRGKADCAGDMRYREEILASLTAEDHAAFEARWRPVTDALVLGNWPLIEAFGYELLRKGAFRWGQTDDIEAKYGVGYGARFLSAARQASARRRLSEFHSTPEELVRAIEACAAAEHVT